MRAINVRIGHDNNFVITALFDIKFIANRRTQSRNQRPNLLRAKHFIKARALCVQDFTTQWQNRLIMAITRLLSRTTRRISLNNEDFRDTRVFRLTIRQLTRQIRNIHNTFTACHFSCFTRRFTCLRRLSNLRNNFFTWTWVFFKPLRQLVTYRAFNNRTHFRRDKLILSLRAKFRIRHLHRKYARQSFAHIFTGKLNFIFLGKAFFLGIFTNNTGQSRTETC